MGNMEDLIEQAGRNPDKVKFSDLCRICDYYFGEARQKGTSHRVYKTPWPGDPRVNIQKGKNGMGKGYQVRQVLKAVGKIKRGGNYE